MLFQVGQVFGGKGFQFGVVALGGVALEQVNRVLVTRDLIVLILLGEIVTLKALQLAQLR